MTAAISLADILHTVSAALEDETVYVESTTGSVRVVSDEEIALLGDLDEDLLAPNEVAVVEGLRAVLASNQWMALPRIAELDEDIDLESTLKIMLTQGGLTLT